MHFQKKHAIFILAILFLCVAIPRLAFPDLDHGDSYTDANVLNAGANFVKFGFIANRFLPRFDPDSDSLGSAYTHFPPLPDALNGLLRLLFKSDSLTLFRGVSLFCSFFTIIFWFLFMRAFSGSVALGFLSSLFFMANPLFIYGADSLHESCYSELIRVFIFFALIVFLRGAGKEKRPFVVKPLCLIWAAVFLESLVTFEYIIYLSLFFLLFRFFYSETRDILTPKKILILFSAPLCGFLLHFAQNVWYFESVSAALNDLKSVWMERALNTGQPFLTSLNSWWKYVIAWNISHVYLFGVFVLILASGACVFIYRDLPEESRRKAFSLLRLWCILMISGCSWYFIFPAHSRSHNQVLFLARHLLPAAASGFTLVSYLLYSFINKRSKNDIARNINYLFLAVIIALVCWAGIKKSDLPVTPMNISYAQEFLKFKGCLLHLKEISNRDDYVGVNFSRNPFMRFYASRRFQDIPDARSLESTAVLPKYFIFVFRSNQKAAALFYAVKEKYKPIFACPSTTLPSWFFELKN